MHPLCLRHHTCESTGLWTAVRDAVTGATTWTSPLGNTYTTRPLQ